MATPPVPAEGLFEGLLTATVPSRDGKAEHIGREVLAACRWPYIVSGIRDEHFSGRPASMITPKQKLRIASRRTRLMA
jgi:hypothetical protein